MPLGRPVEPAASPAEGPPPGASPYGSLGLERSTRAGERARKFASCVLELELVSAHKMQLSCVHQVDRARAHKTALVCVAAFGQAHKMPKIIKRGSPRDQRTDAALAEQIRRAAKRLEAEQVKLEKLEAELELRARERADRTVVAVRFREEFRKCGKETCACAAGTLHGPYLYRVDKYGSGRSVTKYAGKTLPANLSRGIVYTPEMLARALKMPGGAKQSAPARATKAAQKRTDRKATPRRAESERAAPRKPRKRPAARSAQ